MINETRLIDLFTKLCLIDAPSLRERDSVEFVKAYLLENGLEVEEDQAGAAIGGNANNVIAWLRGSLPDAPKVFLSAHFDTVEPTKGLVIREIDGVFSSASDTILGADDKGGMAPAIEAVLALKESGLPHGDVCLLLSVAEEIGLLGAAAMDLERLGLDFGYVLDTSPPVGSFVTRAGTHDSFKAIIRGKPAHAGKEPEKGINAISVAAEAINGMRLGRIAEETTANIGSIHGGSAANVVCPEVKVIAEARSTDVAVLDAQVGHMVQRFEEAAAKFGATVEIDHGRHYVGYTIEPDAPVLRVAREAAASLGLSGKTRTTLGGSDANVFNAKGLSCVVLATGMDKIHTHDEHISRSDLVLTARLSLAILLGVAK